MDSADLSTDLTYKRFDPQTATPADFKSLNSFVNLMRREGWPSESLTKWDELERSKRFLPSFSERHIWIARKGPQVVGLGTIEFVHASHNRHAANFLVEVQPKMRRHGIGKELLQRVAEIARDANRRLLITSTSSFVPSGESFMQRIGGDVAQEMSAYQLDVRNLDRVLVDDWSHGGADLAVDLELGFWPGEYPETDIDEISEMHLVMNSMPRDGLDLEDEVWTPSELRQQDAALRQQGTQRWTVYARSRADGKIAAYTELFWNAAQPALANQGDTGVFPAWRGRGLAMTLKANMLQRLLDERPQVQLVRTWNAATNKPMIGINERLGFRLQHRTLSWQVRLDVVERYLHESVTHA